MSALRTSLVLAFAFVSGSYMDGARPWPGLAFAAVALAIAFVEVGRTEPTVSRSA